MLTAIIIFVGLALTVGGYLGYRHIDWQNRGKATGEDQNAPILMPKNGIYFQKGGFLNNWEGRVVDFDSSTVKIYQSSENKDSQGQPVRKFILESKLSSDEISRIDSIARKSLEENFINKDLNADVNFVLQYYKDSQVNQTETYGPLPDSGAIAELVELINF